MKEMEPDGFCISLRPIRCISFPNNKTNHLVCETFFLFDKFVRETLKKKRRYVNLKSLTSASSKPPPRATSSTAAKSIIVSGYLIENYQTKEFELKSPSMRVPTRSKDISGISDISPAKRNEIVITQYMLQTINTYRRRNYWYQSYELGGRH